MSDTFQNKYRIPSARAAFHAYDGGAYFVTICTARMEHFFGEIANGEMNYTEIGAFAARRVEEITSHYPYAEIPLYVVMPNHVHLIVFIDDNTQPGGRRDVARNVSIKNTTSTHHTNIPRHTSIENIPTHLLDVARNVSTEGVIKQMSAISPKRGSLSVVIRGLKSAVTRYANQNNTPFSWQSRFHDRIIRDQNEMNRIAEYIENNPYNWASDKYNLLT